MTFGHRLPVALVLAHALLLACSARGASSADARVPARAIGAAVDSGLAESPPGRLIAPPADTARAPSAAKAPEDTALASRLHRAREAYDKGLALEHEHAYAAAIISYNTAAQLDPTLRGPAFHIGILYASRQQYRAAARAFQEELRRAPGDRMAFMQYALALCEMGETARSVRMLEGLTRRAPGDANAWRSLGFAYGRAGRQADAERALRGAVGLDSKLAQAWRDLGVVLAARGKDAEARAAYRRALAADPADETSLVDLANLESRDGDHAQALADYREAERRDSTQALAYRGQVHELVALGRVADAGPVWRRWLVAAPEETEAREGAARHFVHVGRTDVALEIARDWVRRQPTSGEAWWLLGEMHVAAQDPRSALTAYREAAKQFHAPEDAARAEAGIAVLRASAPDSLRALFTADSVSAARDARRAGPN